jgi:membrane-bound serine protease (ClpP class)
MCHLLFAVPVVSLIFFGILSPVEATALYVIVNAPLLLFGWHIWKVHRRPPLTGWEGMIGQRAVAETPLQPNGLVRCKGELWRACASAPTEAGVRLRVVAVRNMELLVEPGRGGVSGGRSAR